MVRYRHALDSLIILRIVKDSATVKICQQYILLYKYLGVLLQLNLNLKLALPQLMSMIILL